MESTKDKDLKKSDQKVDQYLISKNLSLSPQQRIENHQSALNLVLELKEAGKKHYEKFKRASQKTS